MQNKLDEFTAALAAKLKEGDVTPDEIKRLSEHQQHSICAGQHPRFFAVTPIFDDKHPL
ncbi:MAG: hypothetical protein Q7U57_17325 [Methylovulum sp.]|nr:hypothetical protein [Methylovulum sp.]